MEINLTQGKVAFVDDEDYERVSRFKWYARNSRGNWYATRTLPTINGKRKQIQMHSFILEFPALEIDHKDGNGLNNSRGNLRLATHSQNCYNQPAAIDCKSGYKGVYWKPKLRKWGVAARVDGRQKHVGYYDDIIVAAKAYDAIAKEAAGEFAWLNFPEI